MRGPGAAPSPFSGTWLPVTGAWRRRLSPRSPKKQMETIWDPAGSLPTSPPPPPARAPRGGHSCPLSPDLRGEDGLPLARLRWSHGPRDSWVRGEPSSLSAKLHL